VTYTLGGAYDLLARLGYLERAEQS
jgi:hypothetical protein